MRWTQFLAGVYGLAGMVGATLHAHAMPIPALGQAAYVALFHTAPLLFLAGRLTSVWERLSASFFSLGVPLFSGSIYLKYLAGWERATVVAPAGGTLLMIGWLFLLAAAFHRR
ncbi:MAG: DUF423 domain-containing protein [Bacteroidia bacterium]|nr:MAG: DUF423 domain-containing protein [Bacteroidia bacterium]